MKARKATMVLTCAWCSQEFEKPLYDYEKAFRKVEEPTFCSRECADRAHSLRMIGAGNSNHKDGSSYARWFRLMRPLILERDGWQCVACRTPELFQPVVNRGMLIFRSRLVVHHIDEDINNNTPANLVTVCQDCHMTHHKSRKTPFGWFGDYASRTSRSMTCKWKEIAITLQVKFSYITV
jgi:hypothetical protein